MYMLCFFCMHYNLVWSISLPVIISRSYCSQYFTSIFLLNKWRRTIIV